MSRSRRTVVVLLGVLALLGVAGVSYAAAARADFGLGISPASQSVSQGATASFTVTASATGGFTGSVTYSVSGLPSGVTPAFTPATVSVPATTSPTSTLAVPTSRATAPGTYNLTITGTSGNTKRTVSATLTVTYALNGSFAISAAPNTVSVAPGSTGVYVVTVARTAPFTGAVTLAPFGVWPSGVTATFSTNPVPSTATTSTLQVGTTAATADGTYTLFLVGTAKDPTTGASTYQYAQAQLVVDSRLSAKPFTISGGAPAGPLAPGVGKQPLDLTLANPNNQPISVTNLSVTVTRTSAGTACDPSNFAVTQYSGPYPVTVPANSAGRALSSLGVPAAQQPQLVLVNKPTNQDGCKGVTVTLSYSGSATGN